MKLKDLRYFEKLVELKNYSRVADHFHVGQPTVSMAIKSLEKEIGYDLIVHSSVYTELTLTSAGKRFHTYSKEVIKKLNQLEKEIERQKHQLQINFGITPAIYNTYFYKLAKKVDEKTLSNINVIENNSHALIKMLKQGKIKLAMVASVKPLALSGFYSKVLSIDEFKVAVSKNNPLAQQNMITFEQINHSKVIQTENEYLKSTFFENLKKEYFYNPNVVYQTNDYSLLKRLIKEDIGISFLLNKSVIPEDGIAMVNLAKDVFPKIHISLVYRDGNDLTELEKNLISTIFEIFDV